MKQPTPSSRVIRVGTFELEPRTGELTRDGLKAQLSVQPLQVLLALLERPGELVTREELVRRLWPEGTFVDFDHSLNKAVNKLREVLGDAAENPTYIETLPRRGYRYIGPVTKEVQAETVFLAPSATDDRATLRAEDRPPPKTRKFLYAVITIGLVGCMALAIMNVGGLRDWAMRRLGLPRAHVDSIAVLPLENLSKDPDQVFFADGMTDALITELAKAGATRVISRTSVMRYKTTQKDVRRIGSELNVDAVVEGTILRSGNRVRITVQLIQVSTDMHLWAQSFERDVSEVLQLQQEMATNIAHQIGSVVQTPEHPRTVNPEAYGAYLKGRYYFLQYTGDGWQKAIDYFNQAIQADPNFAPAYAGLAQSYLVAAGWNAYPPDEAHRKGKEAAHKALELDDQLASAHLAVAFVYAQEFDRVNAEKEYKRGLELNPSDSLAWQQHGNQILSEGRFDEAISEQERARRLDPLSAVINANLARAFYYARRYDNAIAQAQETLKLEPNYPIAFMWLERAYRQKGMLNEAYASRLAASKPEEVPIIRQAYRTSGYRGVLLAEAEAYKRIGALSEAARVYAQAQEKDSALTLLEECYQRRWPGPERLKVDPDFDPLRDEPRFQALMRQMGFD
jgi:TolB-like protein/DNA-binding winged helix-turn-helix (wHTH) protein/cytochrome c-type biogenesis protein CcmH/NrfG